MNQLTGNFLRTISLLTLAFGIIAQANSQSYVLNAPRIAEWYQVEEGDTLTYSFRVVNADNIDFRYRLSYDGELSIQFDSLGNFFWIPSYDLVGRVEESRPISMILEAQRDGHQVNKELTFEVTHKNRPPNASGLPIFYVKQNTNNVLNLNNFDWVNDPDEDPIVFVPVPETMPQGAMLTELGAFSWHPSRTQFRKLGTEHLTVEFIVQDQPEKREVRGQFVIAPTQLDLPPEILIVPSDSIIVAKEDDVINLNFYINDPNGDDNIMDVGFLSNNMEVPSDALVKNTATQWEFKWTPGYEFLQEEGAVDTISLTFFAIDNSGKKNDRKVLLSVADAENIDKKDERLYEKYRLILVETMNLIDQLDENQEALNKQLKKSKKGKKRRAIISASLGAVTGVSPLFAEDEVKDYATALGGTAVLTMGTLEATEVMGKSKDAIMEKLKINIDLRNQLQEAGDNFARKYALKTKRRIPEYDPDIDRLKLALNNQKLILLELPADWENSRKPTDKNIRKTFPDFNNEGFEED